MHGFTRQIRDKVQMQGQFVHSPKLWGSQPVIPFLPLFYAVLFHRWRQILFAP